MTDQSFEFPSEIMALDPVRHISSIASARFDGIAAVHVREVLADVGVCVHEIFIRPTSPATLDTVCEVLAVGCGACGVGAYEDVTLICPGFEIPAVGPGVSCVALGSAVDIENEGVGVVGGEVGGIDYDGLLEIT